MGDVLIDSIIRELEVRGRKPATPKTEQSELRFFHIDAACAIFQLAHLDINLPSELGRVEYE